VDIIVGDADVLWLRHDGSLKERGIDVVEEGNALQKLKDLGRHMGCKLLPGSVD